MVFENLFELSNFLFILVILGYIFDVFFQYGYYGFRFKPLNTTEKLLHRSSIGIFFIILAIVVFSQMVVSKILTIPKVVDDVKLPDTVFVYIFLFAGFISFLIFGIFLIVVLGSLASLIPKKHIHIKTKEAEPIKVREIYAINDDFIFYIELGGNWGSVRKSDVESMKQEDSEFFTQLKDMFHSKNND